MKNKHSKRLSPQTWERVRTDYEVKRMSFNELQQRYEVHRSNISRKAQKQGWNRAQVQHALDERLQAKESLEAAIHRLRLLTAYMVSKPKFATEKRRALEEESRFREGALNLLETASLQGLHAGDDLLDYSLSLENELKPCDYITLMAKALDTHSKALLRYSQAAFGMNGLPC
ncbi:hypothetical protein [uncultured Thiothrix sp.]|uniref:hypothetical protein n=1 Tax=uncultured Thiothrix sp. TaxID=223185 RepID=UPI002638EF74|nr:hypothetical protein [uncultured Thiothrix sp.]HMT93461.1 hypothetical protein [Thiolinea sp.]